MINSPTFILSYFRNIRLSKTIATFLILITTLQILPLLQISHLDNVTLEKFNRSVKNVIELVTPGNASAAQETTVLLRKPLIEDGSLAQDEAPLFGPKRYIKTTAKPNVYTDTFSAAASGSKLVILNGEADGANRVSSAIVSLNGVVVFDQNDFNQQVYRLERKIDLIGQNSLVVELRSNPGSYLTIEVVEDTDPANRAPTADAGPDQTVRVGQTIQLDGSKSTDPDGNSLTYRWSLSAPDGSAASLSALDSVNPAFSVDIPGTYSVTLVVNDGTVDSSPDAVTVSTINSMPVANAGPDQTVFVGQLVTFNGSGSSDVDGDTLRYHWSLVSAPAGSGAALSGTDTVNPSLKPDLSGTYVVQLIVNDGITESDPDTVSVSTQNSPPVADAGPDQAARVGNTVTLDGSKSRDVDADLLTYTWSFSSKPVGSTAAISDASAVKPTFQVDVSGVYVVQLIVSDGKTESIPDTVKIITDNTKPVADAGPDRTMFIGQVVTLNGSGSSDVDGDSLTYRWSFVSTPAGSTVVLVGSDTVNPTFIPDLPGTYVAQLIVNDGLVESDPDTVSLSTQNSTPVADAGPDQTVHVGELVTLDGSKSSDVDGEELTFRWSLISRPQESSASLSDPSSVRPGFTIDKSGTYISQLIVNDGKLDSSPDTATIITENSPPVANAGEDRTVHAGDLVTLNGSRSSDVDGDLLFYTWSFVSKPSGSMASISDPNAVKPTFDADTAGTYVIQIIVNDGKVNSSPDTVTIITENTRPLADAGADQTVHVGDTVRLNGSGSTDADGDPLTFQWSIISKPAGSSATLESPATAVPTFKADAPGTYVVQLIVNDGKTPSDPESVVISTENSRPVANAGADRTLFVGDTATLDGSASRDADGDPLSFQWSFTSIPQGSGVILSNPASLNPAFVPDLPGTYVLQLIVSDGNLASAPDTVTITTQNRKPTANAGEDRTVAVGDPVQLDGSSSLDPDGDPLLYSWSFVSVPSGSGATLSDSASLKPTFTVDRAGTYTVRLTVSDGSLVSEPDTVSITASVVSLVPVVNLDMAPSTISPGESATLSWTSENADSCVIAPGIGTVPLMGATVVSPEKTTTYTITATGPGGTATASATVTVLASAPAVEISAEPATLQTPGRALLSWSATHAETCVIEPEIGTVGANGSMGVFLLKTTQYTITATGPLGSATASVTVTVENPAPIATLSATPDSIRSGETSTLSWSCANAESCVIDPAVGPVDPTGATPVTPTETTIYTITATGPGGAATASARVHVGDSYTYGDPTSAEQAHLEAVNRARMNPSAEAARLGINLNEGLPEGTISPEPIQPLVLNSRLIEAARLHSEDMLARQYYAHNSPDGLTPYDRIVQAGYTPLHFGENIAGAMWEAPLDPIAEALAMHDTLFLDAGIEGRGHRLNILNAGFKEIGVGIASGAFYGYPYAILCTCDFGASLTDQNAFLTGVVYEDRDGDGIYTAGEGIEEAEIRIPAIGARTQTSGAGGYAIHLSPGTYTVEAALPDDRTAKQEVVISGMNVKADFRLADFSIPVHTPEVSLAAAPEVFPKGESTTLSWSSLYATSIVIEPGIGSVNLSGSITISPPITTTYRITASGPFGTASREVTVHVFDPSGAVSVTLSVDPESITKGESATLSWTSTNATSALIDSGIGAVLLSGSLTVIPESTTTYTITATGPSGTTTARATVAVTVTIKPQPKGTFGSRYEDLIPQDAALEVYDAERFSVVTGLARDASHSSAPGVRVRVLDHPEYGSALTDDKGRFSLPVEGGGVLTFIFEREGLLSAQRRVYVLWNDIAVMEDLVLIEPDPVSTGIAFDGNPETVLTHRSSETSDTFGNRSLTVLFSGDNLAFEVDGEGSTTRELTSITARTTEYRTAESLPAELPSNCGYAYTVELKVDEAAEVRFDKPVTLFVENFLGFPVGDPVPVGYLDARRGTWIPSRNGDVVRLLDTNADGVADALDSDGDGEPDDLNGNGSHQDEVMGLQDPAHYPPGSTFLRFSVTHFSSWSISWPIGPKDRYQGAPPNPLTGPFVDLQRIEAEEISSSPDPLIEDRSRILHEDVSLPGTDMRLHYASNRVRGYQYTVRIPVTGSELPAGLKGVIARMNVSGRVFEESFPPEASREAVIVWDGKDHRGNDFLGPDPATAHIRIGYVYEGCYWLPDRGQPLDMSFARNGRSFYAVLTRENLIVWEAKEMVIHRYRTEEMAEGWSLSPHHRMSKLDPGTLLRGDGIIRRNDSYTIKTIAGVGEAAYSGDGGPAVEARLNAPDGMAVDSAGNIYIAEMKNHVVRKIDTEGIITTVAGCGVSGYGGDGGGASSAKLDTPTDVAVDGSGNLYIADTLNSRIRKVSTGGVITTVAGKDHQRDEDHKESPCYEYGEIGDNGPAVEACLNRPTGVAVDREGTIYVADPQDGVVRKIDTGGIISLVTGWNGNCNIGDGGPAYEAYVGSPRDVELDGAGNLFISDASYCDFDQAMNCRVRKIGPDGIITTVAGTGECYGTSEDGIPAVDTVLYPGRLASDPEGNLYILSYNRLRKVDTSGIITTVAGNGGGNHDGDGGPPTRAEIGGSAGVSVGPLGRIYLSSMGSHTVRRISYPSSFSKIIGFNGFAFVEDGETGHIMDESGNHTYTTDHDTGRVLLRFKYDTENRLLSVEDLFGSETRIERDGSGKASAIVSPDGIKTSLSVDSNNHLTDVSYPDGTGVHFEYTDLGLMTGRVDGRGKRYDYTYDDEEIGKLRSILDPSGGSAQYHPPENYALLGKMHYRVETPEGNMVSYQDEVKSTGETESLTIDPALKEIEMKRDAERLNEQGSYPCGMSTEVVYDIDRPYLYRYPSKTTLRTPLGIEKTVLFEKSYDDWEQFAPGPENRVPRLITESTTVNGKTTTFENNTRTFRFTFTSPEKRKKYVAYDSSTLLPKVASIPGLHDTGYTYDARGRLTDVWVDQRHTGYTYYDNSGFLASITDPDDKTTTFEYDPMGRMEAIHRPDTGTVRYDYDENGNMTVLTTPGTVNHGFGYNALNQNESYDTPSSGSYRYTYNKDGATIRIAFPSGKEIVKNYEKSRLVSIQTPEGLVDVTYKACGNLVESLKAGTEGIVYGYDGSLLTSEKTTGTLSQSIGYARDGDFRVSGMTYAGKSNLFSFDKDGLLTGAGRFTVTRRVENGLPEKISDGVIDFSRDFNGYGELDSDNATMGSESLFSFKVIARDRTRRITDKIDSILGGKAIYHYTYDTLGRLESVQRDGATVETYEYNPNGTRRSEENTLRGTSRLFSYSAEDGLISFKDASGETAYIHDADGRLTTKIRGTEETAYNYSSRGELLSVTLPDGRLIEYLHDPLARRIAKKVNGIITEKYLWQDMSRLLAVYDGSDNLIMRFEYADSRMPAAMEKEDALYYLFYDQAGSLRLATDAAGAIVKRIGYDSFGNILSDTNPTLRIPFGFAGGLSDPDTRMVRFGARDYDPDTGRWLAKDPILFNGGDTNLYGYVLNDPVNLVDPDGLRCRYSQGTGQMVCTAEETGFEYYNQQGYAGTGVGRNNPDAQDQVSVGPIPRGLWQTTGNWYNSPNTGRNTMSLEPLQGNPCSGTQRDCSSFRIHGNNAANDASHGCIVLPPNRTTIPPSEIIEVVR